MAHVPLGDSFLQPIEEFGKRNPTIDPTHDDMPVAKVQMTVHGPMTIKNRPYRTSKHHHPAHRWNRIAMNGRGMTFVRYREGTEYGPLVR